jgi:hypothetical protein
MYHWWPTIGSIKLLEIPIILSMVLITRNLIIRRVVLHDFGSWLQQDHENVLVDLH